MHLVNLGSVGGIDDASMSKSYDLLFVTNSFIDRTVAVKQHLSPA